MQWHRLEMNIQTKKWMNETECKYFHANNKYESELVDFPALLPSQRSTYPQTDRSSWILPESLINTSLFQLSKNPRIPQAQIFQLSDCWLGWDCLSRQPNPFPIFPYPNFSFPLPNFLQPYHCSCITKHCFALKLGCMAELLWLRAKTEHSTL